MQALERTREGDIMEDAEPIDHEPWPLRAVLLAALGALFGLLFWKLTRGANAGMWTNNPWEMAAATFVAVSGILFAFSLERLRWTWSAVFAAAAGLVVALVSWWNGAPQDWGAGEGWQFFSSLIAVAIAVPLFESARDQGAFRFHVRAVHTHVWTNLILAGAAGAFVGATFLLTLLLSELFRLIGIDLLWDLLEKGWFGFMLGCGALGAAVGLLRDRDKVLGLLQRVATAILSVLAPALALGLVIFVVALPFTGLEPLWSQTKQTTPILLLCILGSVVLANAVVGNAQEEEARSPILRYAAMGLVAVMLPLALVAAVSTGKRIGQYGFTPDRLWAAVFVAIAAAFALAYLYALLSGRRDWPARLRQGNIRLALGLCGLALFLALPIVSFGAISARDQLGRLQSGKVPPDRFDWAAMRFDFGPAGRRALEGLAGSSNTVIRQRAREALRAVNRWSLAGGRDFDSRSTPPPPPKLRVDGGAPVPQPLVDHVARSNQCFDNPCRLVFVTPARAVLLSASGNVSWVRVFDAQPDGTWVQRAGDGRTESTAVEQPTPPVPATGAERVEVRPVERVQVYIDGRPVGPAFDP